MAEPSFTTTDFHNIVQKQIFNAVLETMTEAKLDWRVVAPFLEAARQICRSDFQSERARIRIHTVQPEGDGWTDAEEAFLGISVAGRDDGQPWLSETYWISDVARADGDPDQVRQIVAALERSLAKLRTWLAQQEKGGPAGAEPPSDSV